MDLYDFYTTVIDGVASDTDLKAWAVVNFGSPVHVYGGMPHDAFPDMTDDVPFVLFGEPSRECSQSRRTINYSFGGWMGLSDKDNEVLVPDDGERPTGIQLILDGMRLVRQAVTSALPEGVLLDDYAEHADANAVGYEVHGDMGFSFRHHLTIGQNPME